jgi:hypothetical protein
MSKRIKIIFIIILLIATKTSLNAQRIALTTNLVEDALVTPNIGVDIVVADNQSVTFDASYAPYKLSQQFYNKCMTFRAGYKYWFNQAFYAHYVGVDAVFSSSDVGVANFRSRDEYIGVGIGYGYSFILGSRLNLIPHVGVGLAYGKSYEGYDQMLAPGQGVQAVATPGFKPILTRFGITIHYILN